MFALFIDFVLMIACIIGAIMNFNRDWSIFSIFIVLVIHSGFHFGAHFRKKFINKWEG